MREIGTVIETSGELCRVSVKRKSACGENCASCKAACNAGEHICDAKNPMGAKPGDEVMLETESRKVLKSAFLVYILPIMAFLTVYGVSDLKLSGVISACLAILAMAVVFALMRIYDKGHKDELLPEIVEIL